MTNRTNPRGAAPVTPEVPVSFLLRVIKHPAFKEVLRLVLAALAGAASSGCGVLPDAKSPALAAFECRAAVLAPYVADAAPSVVAAVSAGDVNPVELLLSLGLTPEEIVSVARAYQACKPVTPETPAEPAAVIGA